MADTTKLQRAIERVKFNPLNIQRVMLEELEAMTKGEVRIVNATNPFLFLLEGATTVASVGMAEQLSLSRKLYPSNAQTFDDLYLHMSDTDYVGVFANPSQTTFFVLISKDEVINKAVSVDQVSFRKITIPRHTEFVISDTKFTTQYPIDIRVSANGGITVTYDTSRPSPVKALESNVVNWFITTIGGVDYIYIAVPVQQMAIKSQIEPVTASAGFKKKYEFDDEFFHLRAFIKNAVGEWTEIVTTHTEQVYDPQTPTVALRVIDNVVSVLVPQIYLTNDLIRDEIRLDLYTTKGMLEMDLSDFDGADFSANWVDHDEENNGRYSAPLNSFSALAVYSDKLVTGGNDGLTFDQLRERVVMNSLGPQNVPITNAQLETRLGNLGFDIVKNLDVVTNRQFLVTRGLPTPPESEGVSAASATMLLLQATFNNLGQMAAVVLDNGNRITVLPRTVYRNSNGIITVIDQAWVDSVFNQSAEARAATVNADNLLFSPFHYVLDINDDQFESRPYSLNSPEVISKFFVAENETTLVQASVEAYQISYRPDDSGYWLELVTFTDDAFKSLPDANVSAQISFFSEAENRRVWMTADYKEQLSSGEYLFRFHITSNFDVTADHKLITTSFKFDDNADRNIGLSLDTTFDVAIVAMNHEPVDLQPSSVDQVVNSFYLPAATNHVGVSHEKVRINVGSYLRTLWARSRSVISAEQYQTYALDVYATYEADVYERDIAGNIVVGWDSLTQTLTYNKLHSIGEPVLDNAVTNSDTNAALDAQNVLTFTLGAFVAGDVGKHFVFKGAGALGADLYGVIDAVTSSTEIVLSTDVLTATVGGEAFTYGDPVVKHVAGETVLDGEGNPVQIVTPRDVVRQADILLVDGKYYFADASESVQYREQVSKTLTQWITQDIERLSETLLEQTEMFFYPKNTVGSIRVIVGEGSEVNARAEQSLNVTYHVTSDVYLNADLRKSLELSAARVIDERLSRSTVSLDDITSKLKAEVGENVVSVRVGGLFPDLDTETATLVDSSARFTLGKRLVVLPDATLGVQDAINVTFIRHRE